MKYSLTDSNAKGHEFVNGNTKFLKNMDQKDLAVLFNNGDPRVKEDATEDKKSAKVVAAPVATV